MGRRSIKRNFRSLDFRTAALVGIGKDGEMGEINPHDEPAMRDFIVSYFQSYNTLDLRALALKMGLHSPTLYTKDELVALIADTIWGFQYFSEGKLPMVAADIDKITPELEMDLIEDISHEEYVIGRRVEGVFEGDYRGGILRLNGYTHSFEDVGVIRHLVNKFGLRNGDFVCGRARYVDGVNFFCLHHIDKINDTEVDKAYTPAPDPSTLIVAPTRRVRLAGKECNAMAKAFDIFSPVMYGRAAVISYRGKIDLAEAFADMYEALTNTDAFDLVLPVYTYGRSDSVAALKERVPDIITTMTADAEENGALVARARDRGSRLATVYGKKVAVLVNDLDSAAPYYNGAMRLMNAAAQYASGGSLTVFAFANRESAGAAYYTSKRFASAELALAVNQFLHENKLDVFNCYTEVLPETKAELSAHDNLVAHLRAGDAGIVNDVLMQPDYDAAIALLVSRK